MIAANADIGVARAAYFPTLTLGGQGGYQSTAFSNWLTARTRSRLSGRMPCSACSMAVCVGLKVAQARAQFDSSAANYRSTVISAFQQVEDDLATLDHYHDAAAQEKAAVDAAQRT